MRPSLRDAAIILALSALLLVPRLIGVHLFTTVDEPYWLTAGSDFYYALGQREFARTVYDYHPAVTTMWMVTAGMMLYFPQYRGLGQGYFDVYKDSLEQFLVAHAHSPLGLLTTARVVQATVIVLLLLIVFVLLRRLLDERTALVALLLLAFDPFFLGHSRLLSHEGLLTVLTMIALLALLEHLSRRQGRGWLVVSAIAMGLAQLTKSSSIVVVPVSLLLIVSTVFFHRRTSARIGVGRGLLDIAIWLLVTATVYFVLWPGMWVEPVQMLREVFGNALNYAVVGSRLSASGADLLPAAVPGLRDVGLFVQSMLWRTTPVTWLGVIFCALLLREAGRPRGIVLGTLIVTGALFILLFGLASGRNSAHYVMFAYGAAEVLAGAGWVWASLWIAGRIRMGLRQDVTAAVITTAAVAAQVMSAAAFFPYYYNYYSPLMEAGQTGRQNPNFGYGEGLDLAARYLDAEPGAEDTTVMAFYGRGPFSYFFRGRTEPLKTVYADAENVPQLLQVLKRSDYLVIYYAIQHGRNAPANVMRALDDVTPRTTIWLNGIEYVRIYALKDMPAAFFERLQQ